MFSLEELFHHFQCLHCRTAWLFTSIYYTGCRSKETTSACSRHEYQHFCISSVGLCNKINWLEVKTMLKYFHINLNKPRKSLFTMQPYYDNSLVGHTDSLGTSQKGWDFLCPLLAEKIIFATNQVIFNQSCKNRQTCKPCLCTFFQIYVNILILPAISFVRLAQEKYIKFCFFPCLYSIHYSFTIRKLN